MKHKIKPLNTIHIYVYTAFILLAMPLNILLLTIKFDITLLLTSLIYHAVIVLCYLFTRLFYSTTYVIDDEFLTEYIKKDVVFKIKISDIEKIYIKKAKWYDFFAFWFDIIPSACCCSHGSTISFVFNNYEILEERKTEIPRQSIKPRYIDKTAMEHVEIFSRRKCALLCKYLNISAQLV